ncbi:hypothetical protein R83H12_00444 [Fibrobacteria bacterium R8-3-H12]
MDIELEDVMPPDWHFFKYSLANFDINLMAVYAVLKKAFPDLYVNVLNGKRIHNWCGLRSAACTIGAVKSAHKTGKALDLHCNDLPMLRKWLENRAIVDGFGRMENPLATPTWCHYDVLKKDGWDYANGIYVFMP